MIFFYGFYRLRSQKLSFGILVFIQATTCKRIATIGKFEYTINSFNSKTKKKEEHYGKHTKWQTG